MVTPAMSRSSLLIVRVKVADLPGFLPLWEESRVALGHSPEWAERASREGRLEQSVARDDVRVYVATGGDEPLGFVVVTNAALSGMTDESGVWIDQLYVRPHARRKGVGKALLAHVTRYADHVGATHVVSFLPAKDRESNRFLARIGFGTVMIARVTSTAILRRRVSAESVGSALLRHRRSLRARGRVGAGV